MDRPVLLCGLGRVGGRVLAHLLAAGVPVRVVSLDPGKDPLHAGVPDGVPFIRGDCRKPEVLEAAGVRDVRGVIIVTSEDLINITTALTVRQMNPDVRIVVRMFNQNLVPRFGAAVRNTVALSVSALVAPLIALTALTGDSLGAFTVDGTPQQVAEVPVDAGSELVNRRLADVAGEFKLLVLGFTRPSEESKLWHDIPGDIRLEVGDRFVGIGSPATLGPLVGAGRGELFAGVRWAGWVRRQFRTARRTFALVDLPVKIVASVLIAVLVASTLAFHYADELGWADSLYRTVSVVATGADLPDKDSKKAGVKVFVSVLKLTGTALIAAFTAILTQYLVRAKLGGAFEARKVPDGGHVVVCGLGNVGFRCVEELVRMKAPVVAVDKVNDNPFAATVRRMGVPVIVGDVTVPEVLRQARVDTAAATIAATDAELINLELALLVREMNPTGRVVVRLTDPGFASAVREAADIKYAVSVPALAGPAFAAALLGDRIQTLVTVAGKTLAIVDVVVQADDPCLCDKSLIAAMIDYGFLPLAVAGEPPYSANGLPKSKRLIAGDRLTVAAELPILERLLRREAAPADCRVTVDAYPMPAIESLLPIVRTRRGCSQEEAVATIRDVPFALAEGLTRGEAEELRRQVEREKVQARVESITPP